MRGTNKARMTVLALTGAALLLPNLTTTAHARRSRARNYKAGAIALGALGAYFAIKKKPAGAAAASAGGYYLYKKGRKEDRRGNDNRFPDDRYVYNGDFPGSDRFPDDRFPTDSGERYPDSVYTLR